MELFKRILKEPDLTEVPRQERRSTQRFVLHPGFQLKAVLSLIGRDDTGVPMSNTRHGWNWKGRLLDCSEHGARMQMGSSLKAVSGDTCDLILTVDDYELTVPCHITNIRELDGNLVLGLKHDIEDEAIWTGYRQLLEVVALGSTLKPHGRSPKPDESGYLVEHYVSKRSARLSVWRHPSNQAVLAFEFQLKDNMVRAAAGQGMEFLAGEEARPATAAKSMELQRLFNWVVPNLAPAVPEDVRAFLRAYAA